MRVASGGERRVPPGRADHGRPDVVRPRAVWLLDSTRPTSIAAMAHRRASVLARHLDSTVVALGDGRVRPHAVVARTATAVEGHQAVARADLVMTTSGATLSHAATHCARGARLVHLAHAPVGRLLESDALREHAGRIAVLVVPSSYDTSALAALATATGIEPDRIRMHDDFTLSGATIAAAATGRAVVAAAHLTPDSGVFAVLDGFALALPDLPGWQLRLLGAGELADALAARIVELKIGNRVAWSRGGSDLAAVHAGAGVAVRLTDDEAYGLPVLDALTSGLPVLGGTGVPAVRALVVDGHNGIVLAAPTPDSVAAALVRFGEDRFRHERAQQAAELPGGQLDRAGLQRLISIVDLALGSSSS